MKIMNKEEIFGKIAQLLKNREAKKIAVFGSYVRGEETPESDIDILVEFSEQKSLLELVKIERELSELIGIKVDLLTEKSISPYLIDSIRKEMEVILCTIGFQSIQRFAMGKLALGALVSLSTR